MLTKITEESEDDSDIMIQESEDDSDITIQESEDDSDQKTMVNLKY